VQVDPLIYSADCRELAAVYSAHTFALLDAAGASNDALRVHRYIFDRELI